jgi:sigma-B regulation protein RsbQ
MRRRIEGQMSVFERNNITLRGNGSRTIVFSHGFGCDQNMWLLGAPAFEQEFRTVLLDHLGAGKSELSAYDPQKYAGLGVLAARL